MALKDRATPSQQPLIGWLCAVIAGMVAPVAFLVLLSGGEGALTPGSTLGPVVAISLMGLGIIAAAITDRMWVGIVFALTGAALLVLFAHALGIAPTLHRLPILIAALVASVSFAARGALFATSRADKGWWIAVAVVAGEAAVIASGTAQPGIWPDWLLVLLPAQWASLALQSAFGGDFSGGLSGGFSGEAVAALIALGATAAATSLVRQLWPRRWTYIVMFTTWLAMAALVYHQSGA